MRRTVVASQNTALSTLVSSIAGFATLEFQSGPGAASNAGAGIYSLGTAPIYRNNDPTDFARLTRPSGGPVQLNCTSGVTASPTPSPSPTGVFYPNPTNVCPLDASSGFPAAIPDDSINPLEVTFNFPDNFTIDDVEICVDIDHTRIGDLLITLEHPTAGAVQLMVNPNLENGDCQGNNLRVLFDDQAGASVQSSCGSGTPALNGVYQPSNSMSAAFDGFSYQGTWTLRVYDTQSGQTGAVRGAWMWINFD